MAQRDTLGFNSLPNLGKEGEESKRNRVTEVTGLLADSNVRKGPFEENVRGTRPLAGHHHDGYVPVEVVCFLYFFNVVLLGPHTQFYVYDKMSNQYGGVNATVESNSCELTMSNSSDDDVELKIQSETATVIMYLTFAKFLCCILPTLMLGSLTDRYGRKLASILSITGMAVKQGIYTAIIISDANVYYLLIGNVLEGVCGYQGGMLASLFATVADVTVPGKERAFRITSLQASLFIAAAISDGVAGLWIEKSGFLIPLYTMMGISLLNIGVVVFLLPETRRRSLTSLTLSESFKELIRSVLLFTRDTSDRRRWKLQVMVFALFITSPSVVVFGNILTLYLLKSPFCWPMTDITLYKAVRLLVDWFCILTLTRCFGHLISDVNVAIIGYVSGMLCLLLIGIAENDVMMYLAAAVGVFTESVGPMLRSTMSRLVSNEDQGALFSSISVLEMVSSAFLGLAATAGYSVSLTFFPGLIFLIFACIKACISVAVGVVSCATKTKSSKTSTRYVKTTTGTRNHRNWLSVSADMCL